MHALRAELDRLGLSYARAGARDYVAAYDAGEAIWLRGAPLSGLSWRGPMDELLELMRRLPDDTGPDLFWRALLG